MSIYKKLHTIQTKINGLGKDSQSFGYKYVSGSKVLEFLKPLMNELGLILKQEVLSIENTRQDYTAKSGSKSEILSKVMMRFTWIDTETGEKDENSFGANGQNDWEKGLGSALTYAERYFLLKYFHIPTDEDDIDNDLRKQVLDDKKKAPSTPSTTQAPTNTKTNENSAGPEKWLNVDSDEWKTLVQTISNGKTYTLAQIRKKYKVSNDTVKSLESLNIF